MHLFHQELSELGLFHLDYFDSTNQPLVVQFLAEFEFSVAVECAQSIVLSWVKVFSIDIFINFTNFPDSKNLWISFPSNLRSSSFRLAV